LPAKRGAGAVMDTRVSAQASGPRARPAAGPSDGGVDSRRAWADAPFWALASLIPLGIFLWFFHWQVLLPSHATWLLKGDLGTHLIGWNAYLEDAWRWPLGATTLVAWPTGATVTYTDSIPLVCLLLKPFAAILPRPFQFTGAWFLACILLHFTAAFMLLRPHARDRLATLAGATLLTLMPTMLFRVVNPSLCAHWLILFTLHAFINVERPARRDVWYGAMFVLSALIHPYLLFMNAGIWATDVLRRGYLAWRDKAPASEFAALRVRSMLILLSPVLAIWVMTGLSGYAGGANGFGFYAMSLDSLINPGVEGYSRFLHATKGTEGQFTEGFQYLGLGLIGVVAAAGLALFTAQGRDRLHRMGWLAWLTPALLVLTALALSDDIRLNDRLIAHVSYDWLPMNLPAMFRASGRLFWPCAYALVVAAFQLVFALPRAFPLVISMSALLIQASDLTAFAADIRSQTAAATEPEHYARTPSPLWKPLIAQATIVEFQPPISYADIIPFYEIAWRATSLRRPVNITYTARINPKQDAIEKASRQRFLDGTLDPTHLYVLLDSCIPDRVDRARIRELDGMLIIPPAAAAPALTAALAPAGAVAAQTAKCDAGARRPG